jgi:hypothetical protein
MCAVEWSIRVVTTFIRCIWATLDGVAILSLGAGNDARHKRTMLDFALLYVNDETCPMRRLRHLNTWVHGSAMPLRGRGLKFMALA